MAISLATLAVIVAMAGAVFVFLSRSPYEISPQHRRAWAQEWTGAARRLLVVAVGLFLLAVLLFALSLA